MGNSFARNWRVIATCGVAISALLPSLANAQDSAPSRGAAGQASEVSDRDVIVVTGTLLRGAPPVGSNAITVGQDKVTSTGAASANELLASVPQATNLFNTVPSTALAGAPNAVQAVRPSLRGLSNNASSSASTLVMFDGHRVAPVGITQNAVDPDLIPNSAIERVDIVTDGGSATYGSDAVGGVINFVTRKRFDGVKVQARTGFANNYRQFDANGIVGKDWGSGSFYVAYSYQHNTALFGRDRNFIKQIDWNTGKPTGRYCTPGNVQLSAFDFSTFSFITKDFALPNLTAGTVNACDDSDNRSAVPDVTRHSGLASLHQDLTSWLTMDMRAYYGERSSISYAPFESVASVTSNQAFYRALPGQDPTATQNVFFNLSSVLGTNPATSTTSFREWGTNTEFDAKLSEKWHLRTLFNYSESNSKYNIQQINQPLLNAAASASSASQAINFYDIASTPNQALLSQIAMGEAAGQGKYQLLNLRAILDGKLFRLPGGEVRVALGYEHMHDRFAQRVSPADSLQGAINSQPYVPYGRSVNSFFGELQVPVVGADNRMPLLYALTLSGSARYDRFSDFGGTTNPKLGVTYKPVRWLSLRGNYSTSFNAPSPVEQLGSMNNAMGYGYLFNAFVRQGDTPNVTGLVVVQGSVPNLKPQTAKTWSMGFDVDSDFGLRTTLNYYKTSFSNLIGIPTPGPGIFTDFPNNIYADVNGVTVAKLQEFASRAPNGQSIIDTVISQRCANANPTTHCAIYELIDFRTGNYGKMEVDGIDFSVNYVHPFRFALVDLTLSGNYTLGRKIAASATSDMVDQLKAGSINSGRFVGQASLGATIGQLRAQATVNHTSGYALLRAANLPQDKVDAFDTVNLFFQYNVKSDSMLGRDLSFTVNVNNLFNVAPPVYKLTGDNGYAPGLFSIGRMIQLGVSKKF